MLTHCGTDQHKRKITIIYCQTHTEAIIFIKKRENRAETKSSKGNFLAGYKIENKSHAEATIFSVFGVVRHLLDDNF